MISQITRPDTEHIAYQAAQKIIFELRETTLIIELTKQTILFLYL